MKTTCLLFTVLIFGAITSPGQDCKTEELTQVQDVVRRVTTHHIWFGFDDKAFSRAGDMTAVAIVKTLTETEMSSPEMTKDVLSMLRMAFACPTRCVQEARDRQPYVTLLLLEHMHNRTSGTAQTEVDETRKYVLQQTSDVK